MEEVEKWFVEALKLPENFFIKDSHKQAKYQVYLQGASVTISGVGDISIGPSKTACVWVETKKKRDYFKPGQAMAELFLLDKICPLNSLVVLTDCNDDWIFYCFLEINGKTYLATFEVSNRGIALAIIKQFVLTVGASFHRDMLNMRINYGSNLPTPFEYKVKFIEQLPNENDDRITDLFDEMSEQELFNISMRKRLRTLRDISNINQLPHVDQFMKLFGDDYENSYGDYGTSMYS